MDLIVILFISLAALLFSYAHIQGEKERTIREQANKEGQPHD